MYLPFTLGWFFIDTFTPEYTPLGSSEAYIACASRSRNFSSETVDAAYFDRQVPCIHPFSHHRTLCHRLLRAKFVACLGCRSGRGSCPKIFNNKARGVHGFQPAAAWKAVSPVFGEHKRGDGGQPNIEPPVLMKTNVLWFLSSPHFTNCRCTTKYRTIGMSTNGVLLLL